MTAVKFNSFTVSDKSEPLSLDNMFRRYAAFGGILKLDTNYLCTQFDTTSWPSSDNGGSGVITTNNRIERNAITVALKTIYGGIQPPISFVMSFYAYENDWAVKVRESSSVSGVTCFKIQLVSGTNNKLRVYNMVDDVETLLMEKQWTSDNRPVSLPMKVTIAVRDEQGTTDDTKRQIGISIWFNEEQVLCVGTIVSTVYGQFLAFDVPAGPVASPVYDRLTISRLAEIIPVSSIDPGEAPMTAIQRALEDRYIRWWVRWDGSMFVFYPVGRSAVLNMTSNSEYSLERQRDTRQLFSHIRVMGALQWVQLKDDALVQIVGHRFKEFNSPSLWTSADCVRVGQSLFVRAKEQADRARMVATGLPFLEPEDRLAVPVADGNAQDDYIVDGLKWATNPDGSITLSMELRGYNY